MDANTTSVVREPCKYCGGRGIQHNTRTGLTVICPYCGEPMKVIDH